MRFSLKIFIYSGFIILLVICLAYISILNSKVTNKLEGVLWTLPAKVYARPLELADGGKININYLKKELEILSYESVRGRPLAPGQYSVDSNIINIFLRGFEYQESDLYKLEVEEGKINYIKRKDGIHIDLIQLEPLSIGGMYPSHFQDRILLNPSEVPEDLKQIILIVEDKDFFEHGGVSLKSIIRAFAKNTRAMNIEQGGSTITQQLAKSFFFSSEKCSFSVPSSP